MTIRFTDDVGDFVKLANQHIRVTVPEDTRESSEDIGRILTNTGRKYIPAAHRRAPGQKRTDTATGRLWSGWGKPGDAQTTNPDYSEADNVYVIRRRRGRNTRYQIIVGTTIDYAQPVNDGLPLGQGRTAYHFREKAKVESQDIIMRAIDARWQKSLSVNEITTAKRKFNAAKQIRSIKGRFLAG